MPFPLGWILFAGLAPIISSGLALIHPPVFAQMLGPLDGGPTNPFDLERVRVGDPAPDFVLLDYQNRPVQLSRFRGKKNVILVFYRGHW